ncbi:hypothetical protein BDB01DRAFT_775834 [Pilobolus umbonatus]|nr:hypothetical protein BDB01DRAFT_775834 [Pilobolus umbonatus]
MNNKLHKSDSSPCIMGAFIILLDIWIVYGTIMSNKSLIYKLGWTIAITMFPFSGLVLFLPISLCY